ICVKLDYSLPDLVEHVRVCVAAVHRAAKIKVGSVALARDVERVRAVREVLGPERLLMVDANQRWDVPGAVRALAGLAPFGLHFVEEPLPAEDLVAHARLRERTDVPFAVGENLRTVEEFERAVDLGVCDIAQPNVVRVGGITPFLGICEVMARRGVPVAPHLLPELSGQLALCLPRSGMVEDIDRASLAALGALACPSGVTFEGDVVRADTGPGHGLVFADTLTPVADVAPEHPCPRPWGRSVQPPLRPLQEVGRDGWRLSWSVRVFVLFGSARGWGRAFPFDDLTLDGDHTRRTGGLAVQCQCGCAFAHFLQGQAHGGQGRGQIAQGGDVVEPSHGQVGGYAQPQIPQGGHGPG